MGPSFRSPTSFEELWPLLEQGPPGSVMPIAGGTDLLLAMEFGRWAPERLVSLAHVPFPGITVGASEVRIGGMVTLREIERDARIRRVLPALPEACADVGSVQLRHRATLAGNVIRSSSSSDLLPPLLALDARLVLRSRGGRRTVPLEGFLRGSWETGITLGEVLEEIVLSAPRASAYRWQRVRPANDISQVGVAAAFDASAPSRPWRLVAGGTSPTVQRLTRAEGSLRSPRPSREELGSAAEAAASEAVLLADLRAAEAYRRRVLGVLVERAVRAAAASLSPEVVERGP